ncbi:ligand-gated channel protein [Xenorhabdus bovienii]|uniref:Ligand-gated channel protein n=1 Tax=Xenorhabdus bovienii TaxID=40576 RepID=A0AAJ1J8A0_XENBV|nr:ligand-gated channel protein [Xenorhabdus bovienii]MDE1478057.1 ligand-gated channel protein [Xenorhabdus bovienii]MDE9436292.1 ligand-gated channel protein [Xenorhabdus bovienii]MDE9497760.1 ligand-gated channel protein [Xenorhabdus bovienii]MDE9509732.1 ligand-gated channel protein [Xenorhabdus bovienii]MDE9521416.1 ligand-gated channel protein [Xenorhabdus bovienii]
MAVFVKRKIVLGIIAAISSSTVLAANNGEDKIVVTTAAGFQQKIEDAPASISVVSREQLETKSYRDVTDALKDVPGVVVTGGGSSSDISIRGMASKYTMILIDGKRVDTRSTRPNSDGSGIEQGWLPPLASIERIEVVRGPMSSLYGSDAMGGVINIITRKVQKEWHTSLRADTTLTERKNSGNSYQTSAYAAGPLIDGLLGLKVNGLFSHRNEDKFIGGFREQEMRNGAATFSLTPDEQNTFEFEAGRYEQDRDSTIGKTRDCQPTSCKDDISRYKRNNYSITHNGVYDLGTMTSYVQRDESHNPEREMKYNDTLFNNQTTFILDDHTLSVGGQYRYEDLRDTGNKLNSAKDVNKLTRWSWALFAEDEWQMTNDFALTGGARLNKDENFGAHWTPRLYGVWHADEQWTIKGGVSTGYRSPELRQVAPNWGQATGGRSLNGMIIGNSDLKPEKSVSEEISVIWNNQDNFNVGVTVFNTDFKDKITEVGVCDKDTENPCKPTGDVTYDFINKRTNLDKANIRGIEATLNWDIVENLSLAASYTYTESEQKSGKYKGQALNKMPKHMANSTLNWQALPEMDTWTRINFRSKSTNYVYRSGVKNGTPSYTFVDLGMTYNLTKNLRVLGGIYNVFDKRVTEKTHDAVLDGRRYNIGINYDF